MSRSFDQFWMRRAKMLTQALIISGTINIGLIGTFVYFVLKDKNAAISVEVKLVPKDPVAHVTNEQILRSYSSLTFQDLLLKLENKDLIEEGFTQRDLALACLVTFHHFNIDQALGGMVPQKRSVFFRNQDATESVDVIVYPGLLDDQFEGILSYAKTEKWPFTSKGLFFEVKRSSPVVDASLLDAFYTTAEFFSVYTFLHKVGLPIEKTLVAALLAEGDWEPVAEFCEQQRLTQDFSDEKRRSFLLSYFEKGRSKIASSLLAVQDLDFVLKRLDDTFILSYLELIEDKKNIVERAAKELLVSPRGDEVRKRAAQILYSLSGEPSENYEYLSAVKRFCPEFLPKPIVQADKALSQSKAALTAVATETKKGGEIVAAVQKKKVHVIQDGDSLWKISRKYKVSIEEIKKLNQLETEKLRVGKSIQIPESKS